MPETRAHAISGVRLEHDHGAHLSGAFMLHHPHHVGRAYPAWVPPIARFASRARTILPIFSEPEFFPIA
jgi:hypothetical protein